MGDLLVHPHNFDTCAFPGLTLNIAKVHITMRPPKNHAGAHHFFHCLILLSRASLHNVKTETNNTPQAPNPHVYLFLALLFLVSCFVHLFRSPCWGTSGLFVHTNRHDVLSSWRLHFPTKSGSTTCQNITQKPTMPLCTKTLPLLPFPALFLS